MQVQEIIFNEEHHVRLTAYLQETGGEFGFEKRPVMLVLPGGGYVMCSDREADPVAMPYLKAGYQVFILRYTLKQDRGWPAPLEDYERAMELIRERAEEWHVQADKVAVVGFSAGGHLAACAATIARNRPGAAILVYPATLRSMEVLAQPEMVWPAEHVDEHTCPCFLVAARDDNVVPVQNTLKFATALADYGIAFEEHVYSYGGHGFTTAESHLTMYSTCPRVPRWVEDSIGWLEEVLGRLTPQGFTEPLYPANLHQDRADTLSVYCTLGHMQEQSQEAREILKVLYEGIRAVAKERGLAEQAILTAMRTATVKEMLELAQVPAEAIASLDAELKKLPNRK